MKTPEAEGYEERQRLLAVARVAVAAMREYREENDTRTPALQKMTDAELRAGVEAFTEDGGL